MANSHKLVAQADAHAPAVHATSHQTGGSDAIKIDDLAAGDDNTDLNVSTSKHGLAPKISGSDGDVLTKSGTAAVWSTPGGAGAVATDTIWDAAGDLVQGTGANTAAKLSAGLAGQTLKSAGAAAANVWAYPPGYEFDYVAFTSPVTVSGTSEGAATTVVTGNSVTYDGSTTVMIEFYAPRIICSATQGTTVVLLEDSTVLGQINFGNTNSPQVPATGKVRRTPSNASHTYTVKAWITAGSTSTIQVGAGGSGTDVAGFIRITKV